MGCGYSAQDALYQGPATLDGKPRRIHSIAIRPVEHSLVLLSDQFRRYSVLQRPAGVASEGLVKRRVDDDNTPVDPAKMPAPGIVKRRSGIEHVVQRDIVSPTDKL